MTSPSELVGLSLREASGRLQAGQASSRQLTEACLARIAATDGRVGAFLTVTAERALSAARASDARRAAGQALGPLDAR